MKTWRVNALLKGIKNGKKHGYCVHVIYVSVKNVEGVEYPCNMWRKMVNLTKTYCYNVMSMMRYFAISPRNLDIEIIPIESLKVCVNNVLILFFGNTTREGTLI